MSRFRMLTLDRRARADYPLRKIRRLSEIALETWRGLPKVDRAFTLAAAYDLVRLPKRLAEPT
jgi:hypothetical protein